MKKGIVGFLIVNITIMMSACSESGIVCGEGTVLKGNTCIVETSCGEGTTLINGVCTVDNDIIVTNPDDTESQNQEDENVDSVLPDTGIDESSANAFEFDSSAQKIYGYDISFGKDVVIPKLINGVEVLIVGEGAFQGLGISSVVIPEGVLTLEYRAFDNNNLESITLPSTLSVIEEEVFSANPIVEVYINGDLSRFNNIWTYIGLESDVSPNSGKSQSSDTMGTDDNNENSSDIFEDDVNINWETFNIDSFMNREPDLVDRGYSKYVYIEADNKSGFNFPYIITLPSSRFQDENSGRANRIMMNTLSEDGHNGNWTEHREYGIREIVRLSQMKAENYQIAEQLHIPAITVIVPSPCLKVNGLDSEWGRMRFRSLNYDSLLVEEAYGSNTLEIVNNSNGDYWQNCSMSLDTFDVEDLFSIEEQFLSIVDDATLRLNQAGWNIEDEIFLWGYSNTGHFAKNFTMIYPERVKAMFSGGAFEVFVPMEEDSGYSIRYPYGIGDYDELFGRTFDKDSWDKVAKYSHLGRYETSGGSATSSSEMGRYLLYNYYDGNDNDYLSLYKNNIIKMLENSGNGMFVIDMFAGHGLSGDSTQSIMDFFDMNLDSDEPVYFDSGSVGSLMVVNVEEMNLSSFPAWFDNQIDGYGIGEIFSYDSSKSYICVGDTDGYWPMIGTKYGDMYCDSAGIGIDSNYYVDADIILIATHGSLDFVRNEIDIEEQPDNSVISYINDDGKRVIILTCSDDNMVYRILNQLPEDLLENDYELQF